MMGRSLSPEWSGEARLTHTHHTLDKNGSLYDPAGTESCDMQIRLVT